MKKVIVLTAIAVLVSSLAFAEWHSKPHTKLSSHCHGSAEDKPLKPHNPMEVLTELDLSEDQEDLIHDYFNDFAKKKINIMADIKIMELEKREMLKDKDFVKAKQKVNAIFEKKMKLEREKIDLKESIWKVLTKEQQDELEKHPWLMNKPHKYPFPRAKIGF